MKWDKILRLEMWQGYIKLSDVHQATERCPPEIINFKDGDKPIDLIKADAWALGVFMYELFNYGKPPFTKEELLIGNLVLTTVNIQPKVHNQDKLKYAIKALLNEDPAERCTPEEALAELKSGTWLRVADNRDVKPENFLDGPYYIRNKSEDTKKRN